MQVKILIERQRYDTSQIIPKLKINKSQKILNFYINQQNSSPVFRKRLSWYLDTRTRMHFQLMNDAKYLKLGETRLSALTGPGFYRRQIPKLHQLHWIGRRRLCLLKYINQN